MTTQQIKSIQREQKKCLSIEGIQYSSSLEVLNKLAPLWLVLKLHQKRKLNGLEAGQCYRRILEGEGEIILDELKSLKN